MPQALVGTRYALSPPYKTYRLLALLLSLLPTLGIAEDNSYASIAKRLEPSAIVDVLGEIKKVETKIDDSARPPRGGNEIFQQYCVLCHGTGAAGSPKFGCKSDWAPHIAKGMPTLIQHALNGFNFMPAKGNCVDCNQAELEDAIQYMIDHSKQNNDACRKTN